VQTPANAERIEELGAEPIGNTSQQFSAFVRNEIAKSAKLAQQINLQPE